MHKLLLSFMTISVLLLACKKDDELKINAAGTTPALKATTNIFNAAPADSSNELVTFSWTYPNYATEASNHKYILQIDSAGRNFQQAYTREIMGDLSASFTAKEMNVIMLNLGFKLNFTYGMEARIISSYGNNNERLFSNILSITATPYKVPPKVELPSTNRLFIIGGATDFGWNQANPMPAVRELTRLDETTWGGIYHINPNAGSGYLLISDPPNWNPKYSIQDNSLPGVADAGSFGLNFPADFSPNVSQGDNWYKMIFDFQYGKYMLSKEDFPLKEELYITGDATPNGWVNNPSAAQRMTMLSNGVFEIVMPLVSGKYYKFLNTNGAWQPQFGGSNAAGGDLGSCYIPGTTEPPAIPTPSVDGNYKIQVNFITRKYLVTLQ